MGGVSPTFTHLERIVAGHFAFRDAPDLVSYPAMNAVCTHHEISMDAGSIFELHLHTPV